MLGLTVSVIPVIISRSPIFLQFPIFPSCAQYLHLSSPPALSAAPPEDRDRLLRAIKREGKEAVPDYREVCRRYLADEEDFSEDIISECGIKRRFRNDDIDRCTDEIAVYISESV